MEKDAFKNLKHLCTEACHERHACTDGFKKMMASENVSQMMGTWRRYLDDLTNSMYVDVIRQQLPDVYPTLKADMNKAGIYLNECSPDAPQYVRVIVTDCTEPIHIFGDARCYVLGEATVVAHDHAHVYNNGFNAQVVLHDNAYGKIMAGKVSVHDRASVQGNCNMSLHDRAQCNAFGGTVHGYGYLRINAYGNAQVYAISRLFVNLHGEATYTKLKLNDADQ